MDRKRRAEEAAHPPEDKHARMEPADGGDVTVAAGEARRGKNFQKNRNKKKGKAKTKGLLGRSGSNRVAAARKPLTLEKRIKSNAHATAIIRKFHELTKKLAALRAVAKQDTRTSTTALLLEHAVAARAPSDDRSEDSGSDSDRDGEAEQAFFANEHEYFDGNGDDRESDSDEAADRGQPPSDTPVDAQIRAIEAEIEALGGIKAYQDASIFNHTFHQYNTAKWVVSVLEKLDLRPHPQAQPTSRLNLLDVGALTNHYLPHAKWIQTKAIDLVPRHPSVEKMDFFDLPETSRDGSAVAFDAVVLSLVINCVPLPTQRGSMLLKAARLLAPRGLVFIILPLPCIENSRYLDEPHMRKLMAAVGFAFVESKTSPKLWFSVWRLEGGSQGQAGALSSPPGSSAPPCLFPKKVLRTGKARNNFCIVF